MTKSRYYPRRLVAAFSLIAMAFWPVPAGAGKLPPTPMPLENLFMDGVFIQLDLGNARWPKPVMVNLSVCPFFRK